MDRIGINPLSAVRLLLVSGLFVVMWLIFGAGTAQAAESSPATGSLSQPQPAAAGGLLPSLAGPVTSLVTPAHPPAPPVPAAQAPALLAPILQNPVATTPVTDAVTPVLAPVAELTKQATQVIPPLPSALTAPIAPVTQLVTDAIQPVSGPANSLTGSALSLLPPLEQPLVQVPLTGVTAPPVTSLPASAGAVETPVSGTAEGALTPRQPAAGGPAAVPTGSLPASFPLTSTRGHSAPLLSMTGQGSPLQRPSPARGGDDPFVLPAPVSNTGSQGQSGAGNTAPAGQMAVADLGYRFVLPVTRDGVGSVFSFVLPGTPAQETGFSPD
ncbi:hypothetical protein [Arthrobacter sp. MMS18-M83]|uniref:hypothetical protein n=1 Tax=Arthrobacter sp. MMS18-M83 TaxID=2996261 RepID=UPI00227B38A2|nr:hypothetical protein [Arthrobacter sp. MMS18-M83]WAH98149.1 hypothetical protein OW521_04505 [Arthrobacter sp. MMS18-M83]